MNTKVENKFNTMIKNKTIILKTKILINIKVKNSPRMHDSSLVKKRWEMLRMKMLS